MSALDKKGVFALWSGGISHGQEKNPAKNNSESQNFWKPIVRGHRLAVEHVLAMLAAGDSAETIREGYPWLEQEDIQACLLYASKVIGHERVELFQMESQQ